MKKSYKDYVYLKISKEEFEKHLKEYKKDKSYKISFYDILKGRVEYENEMLNKKDKALEAARIKKAVANIKIYKTLERFLNSLFKRDINISLLAKEAKVHYNTAKKFWIEKNLDIWLEKIKKDEATLRDFLIEELTEDALLYNSSKAGEKNKIKILM